MTCAGLEVETFDIVHDVFKCRGFTTFFLVPQHKLMNYIAGIHPDCLLDLIHLRTLTSRTYCFGSSECVFAIGTEPPLGKFPKFKHDTNLHSYSELKYSQLYQDNGVTSRVATLKFMVYNMVMNNNEDTAIELYNEDVQVQQIMRVRDLQVEKNLSVAKACKEIGLSPRTFYSWLSKDVFTEHLKEARKSRQNYAAAQAVGAMPSILNYLIGLATGADSARGASPIAAAKLVLEIANTYVEPDKQEPQVGRTTYVPQQVVIMVQDGAPVLGDLGQVVIDVEANPRQTESRRSAEGQSHPDRPGT